jgi:hypothetical protein
MIGEMFKYWRGDMIYRFKIICTKYHRGRLRITWDPVSSIAFNSDTTTSCYNQIVDITKETDVEFVVPYTQATSYREIATSRIVTWVSGSALGADLSNINGVLTVRVLNSQTSPELSADIKILVFVRPADNIKFANPKPLIGDLTPYTVQSQPMEYDDPSRYNMGLKPSMASNNLTLIYNGEDIQSLRQLMRRQNFIYSTLIDRAYANSAYFNRIVQPRMPLYYGFDGNGIHVANTTLSAGTAAFNFVNSSILNWINQCYVAHKGSVIWNINVGNQNNSDNFDLTASRDNLALSLPNYNLTDYTVMGVNSTPAASIKYRNNGFGGISMTNQNTQSGLNVSVPMYSNLKFLPNGISARTLGESEYGTNTDTWTTTICSLSSDGTPTNDLALVDFYCGIGTDFSSIFFLNVPTLYVLTNMPVAV